jgi:sulfhydrogenase subunit beta (sulfur reductase)
MKVLKTGKIEQVLDRLAQQADVYAPMLRGQQSGFFSWRSYDEDYDDLMFDILNVYQPPKDIVLPQTEKMYKNSSLCSMIWGLLLNQWVWL